MGEYEPNDSRNVTGTASTPDGRWTGQAANDPTRQDQMQAQQGGQANQQGFSEGFSAQEAAQGGQSGAGQMQQSGQSVGQQNDGVSGASNQGNDHTSAIGRNQGAQGSQAGSAQMGGGQAQQFQDTLGQHGAGGSGTGRFADQIAKHQEVVDSVGNHVGTVDHLDGDRIKLTRKDSADGEHHYVSLAQVEGIEGGRIRLSGSGDVAR